MYCWIWFANILLRIYVHQGYWHVIFFSCEILVLFWHQGNAGFIKWDQNSPSSSILWQVWEILVLILLWMFGWIYQWKHLALDFLLLRDLFVCFLIHNFIHFSINLNLWREKHHTNPLSNGLSTKVASDFGMNSTLFLSVSYLFPDNSGFVGFSVLFFALYT